MTSLFRRIVADDRGVAMATVSILGVAVIMITIIVTARGMRQLGNTDSDARWEQALHVAESGIDVALTVLDTDPDFTTGEVVSTFPDPDTERSWVITQADSKSSEDVIGTPEGEYVVIKPANSGTLYSVGYAPSRAAGERRVRVVRTDVGSVTATYQWVIEYAFLSGDDLEFIGNPTFLSGNTVGVHSNEFLSVGGSTFIDGCMTASNGAKITGSVVSNPNCETPGAQDSVVIPVVDAEEHWHLSQYDLCTDGSVRAGPSYSDVSLRATSEPCDGAILAADTSMLAYRGWKFTGWDDVDGATWVYDNDGVFDGVYYFDTASVTIGKNPGSEFDPWQTTIIAAGEGSCLEDGIVGGDIRITGNPDMVPYPGTTDTMMLADRDLLVTGNPGLTGLMGFHEQIKISGDLDVDQGYFLAEHACHTDGSAVEADHVSGNPTIQNYGEMETVLTATRTSYTLVAWDEL